VPARIIVVLALAITATACERLWPSQPSVADPANGQLSAVESSVRREFNKASAAVRRTLGLAPRPSVRRMLTRHHRSGDTARNKTGTT
jgi:hypothetical protein